MRGKSQARTIYLVTIAAMIALTGGLVMATAIGPIATPPAQAGGYTSAGNAPSGVSTTGTSMSQAGATSAATTNTIAAPYVLTVTTTSGSDSVYLNQVTNVGDFVQTVTVTITGGSPGAPTSTEYAVSIYIGGATSSPTMVYVETSSTLGNGVVDTVSFVYDIGSGSTSVTISSVSDLVTQCSSVGTC